MKDKRKLNIHRRLSASFTVEATVVVTIVLITLGSLILLCFSLHDQAMARNTLLLSLEEYLYGPQPENGSEKACEILQDTDLYFLKDLPTSITIHDGLTDILTSVEVTLGEDTWKVNSSHISIETLMRVAAVKDGLEAVKERKAEEGKENGNGEGAGSNQ